MKSRISPTSPKNQQYIDQLYRVDPTIQKPARYSSGLLLVMLLASIIGSVAAYAGLRAYADRHPLYRVLQPFRSSLSSTEKIIIQQQSTEKTAAVADIVAKVESSLATVVRTRSSGLPQLSDRIGNNTFVSSDGVGIAVGISTQPAESVMRGRDGQNMKITDQQVDLFTGIVVVHTNDKTTAIPFASDQSVSIGMPAYVVTYNVFSAGSSVTPTTVASVHARAAVRNSESLIESSEKLGRFILLADPVDDASIGAAVVNERGELIGIISGTDAAHGTQVIPVRYIRQIVSLYQPGTPMTRPFLGVRYLDLAYAPMGADQRAKGARIDTDDVRKAPPVLPKSPASAAGLRQGDVVMSVDSTPLNDAMSLSEALSSYQALSTIELTIIRQGKEQRVKATLSSNTSQ